MCKINK